MRDDTRARTLATKFLALTDAIASARVLGGAREVQLSQRRLDAFKNCLRPADRKQLLEWLHKHEPAGSATAILLNL